MVKRTAHWLRALPRQFLAESTERVSPPCAAYSECGGCQLQHLNYESQLRFKQKALEETLHRIAHLDCLIEPPVASGPLEYRNKITLLPVRSSGAVAIGLHRWDDPEKLIEIQSCPQLVPALNGCLPQLSSWLRHPSIKQKLNDLSRIILRRVENNNIMALFLRWNPALKDLTLPEGISALHLYSHNPRGAPRLMHSIGVGSLTPLAFRQANEYCANLLYQRVADLATEATGSIIDAYSGLGELTVRMAGKSSRPIYCIEWDREAVEGCRALIEKMGLKEQIRSKQGRVEKILPKLLPASLVVLDPPRAGCAPEVLQALIQNPPERIIYISCHPAAMARDLKILVEKGLKVERIIPYDMFPQTFHLEVLAVVEKRDKH